MSSWYEGVVACGHGIGRVYSHVCGSVRRRSPSTLKAVARMPTLSRALNPPSTTPLSQRLASSSPPVAESSGGEGSAISTVAECAARRARVRSAWLPSGSVEQPPRAAHMATKLTSRRLSRWWERSSGTPSVPRRQRPSAPGRAGQPAIRSAWVSPMSPTVQSVSAWRPSQSYAIRSSVAPAGAWKVIEAPSPRSTTPSSSRLRTASPRRSSPRVGHDVAASVPGSSCARQEAFTASGAVSQATTS